MVEPSDKSLETLRAPADAACWHIVLVGKDSSAVADCLLPEQGQITIGRAADCELYFDDRSISRRHAVVRIEPGWRMTIEDLGWLWRFLAA